MIEKYQNKDLFYLDSLDIVVSERCSLKCKNCSNLMQYYKNPVNCNVELLISDLEKILKKVHILGELRILGGEPFMNQDFIRIIKKYENNAQIRKIGIFTNATIMPADEVLRDLKGDKIVMHLSDYGKYSYKFDDWKDFCDKNGVTYIISKMDEWHDCGKLEKRDYDEEGLKIIYSTCECNNVYTLLNGKIYNCPYSAHASNLGAMDLCDIQKDGFDIRSGRDFEQEELSKFLFERKYLQACNYCSGRNYERAKVKPYDQIGDSLDYQRRV